MTKRKPKPATAISLLCLMADLAKKDGIRPCAIPGLWERRIDQHWTFKMNAHGKETDRLPKFTALVEYNGFPAGLLNPGGGTFAAGEVVNAIEFSKALRRAARHEKNH